MRLISRPIATQIIYITTPPKRPKVLKHAHTFPPDKKSNPKTADLKISPDGKRSTRKRSINAIAEASTEPPSRKRAATSSLSSDGEAKDHAGGERVIKKARLGPTPMSPPDTPDKTAAIDSNPLSVVDARTITRGIASPKNRLPMSPPTSPPLPLISASRPKMDSTQMSGSAAPQFSGS